jgi:hypothetical protein
MKKNLFAVLLIALTLTVSTMAQDKKDDKKMTSKSEDEKIYKANPDDVSTIDGIIKATYDVISGEANKKRDWDRFRSLFYKDARLIPTGTNPENGVTGAKAYSPEEYIKRSEPFMMQNGFFEKEIARRMDRFGNIVQIFSTYEGRYKQSDEKAFLRGINSFQLLNDGTRWWIVTIYWQAESPKLPLPEKYLKSEGSSQ